jgi:hypothetical protein
VYMERDYITNDLPRWIDTWMDRNIRIGLVLERGGGHRTYTWCAWDGITLPSWMNAWTHRNIRIILMCTNKRKYLSNIHGTM